MKKNITLLLILILFLTLALVQACHYPTITIQEQTISNKNDDIQYPEIIGLNTKKQTYKINKSIYEKTLNLKKELKKYKNYKKEYNYITRYKVTYHKNGIVSILLKQHLSIPALAHPINKLDALTFHAKFGTVFKLKHLFKFGYNYRAKINKIVLETLEKKEIKLLKKFKGIEKNQDFYLTPDAIILCFQEYAYTNHSQGPLTISIPYKNLKNSFWL